MSNLFEGSCCWWPWLLSRLEDFGPAFSGWITTHTTGMDRHSIEVPELQIIESHGVGTRFERPDLYTWNDMNEWKP